MAKFHKSPNGWNELYLKKCNNDTVILVCDGFFQPKRSHTIGVSSWRLESLSGLLLAYGNCVTSHPEMSAYRAELIGILGCLQLIHEVNPKKRSSPYPIGCDCSSALCSLNNRWYVSARASHRDICWLIWNAVRKLTVGVTQVKIEAHTDKKHSWSNLTQWERANVLCDKEAKRILIEYLEGQSPQLAKLPKSNCTITNMEGQIFNAMPSHITYKANLNQAISYLVKKYWFSNSASRVIDWTSLETTCSSFSPGFLLWWSKHLMGFNGLGSMMEKTGEWPSALCKICKDTMESSSDHMLICQQNLMKIKRTELFHSFFRWLDSSGGDPVLCISLSTFIRTGAFPLSLEGQLSPLHIKCLIQMEGIGVRGVLHGFLPCKLKECHLSFAMSHTDLTITSNWVELVMKKLITLLHTLWKFRCQMVHKNDEKEERSRYKQEVWDIVNTYIHDAIESKEKRHSLIDELQHETVDFWRCWLMDEYIDKGWFDKEKIELNIPRGQRGKKGKNF